MSHCYHVLQIRPRRDLGDIMFGIKSYSVHTGNVKMWRGSVGKGNAVADLNKCSQRRCITAIFGLEFIQHSELMKSKFQIRSQNMHQNVKCRCNLWLIGWEEKSEEVILSQGVRSKGKLSQTFAEKEHESSCDVSCGRHHKVVLRYWRFLILAPSDALSYSSFAGCSCPLWALSVSHFVWLKVDERYTWKYFKYMVIHLISHVL